MANTPVNTPTHAGTGSQTSLPANAPTGSAGYSVVTDPNNGAGMRWLPTGYILGSSAAGWSHTGDTNETMLVAVTVPANAIGLGTLEIIHQWTISNTASNKTPRVRFGPANDLTGTVFYGVTQTTNTGAQVWTGIRNRTTNSQVSFPASLTSFNNTTLASPATGAADTTAATYVVFSAQLASAVDTITLENYIVRLIPAV